MTSSGGKYPIVAPYLQREVRPKNIERGGHIAFGRFVARTPHVGVPVRAPQLAQPWQENHPPCLLLHGSFLRAYSGHMLATVARSARVRLDLQQEPHDVRRVMVRSVSFVSPHVQRAPMACGKANDNKTFKLPTCSTCYCTSYVHALAVELDKLADHALLPQHL